MKTFVQGAVMLLAAAAICQACTVFAEDIHFVSDTGRSVTLVGDQKTVDQTASSCCEAGCCEQSCGSCCCNDLGCDECPSRGIVGFAGLDAFKGISDGSYPSNFGAVTGLNAATPIPGMKDYGLGWQLGLSYGIYDFDGRGQQGDTQAQSQTQIFVTTGFYRKAKEDQRLSFGLVYDWMINNNWGVFATTPTLGQWRGQVEYALSGCNAVGMWGCVRDLGSRQYITRQQTLIETRAISQVNLFWHHKFNTGADSWLWLGLPENTQLSGLGSLGAWMAGATLQAPLSDRLALYANGSYFRPNTGAGVMASVQSGFDVSMGVAWYFGRNAVSHSINGACWLPYMPVGNNSTFLVDQHPAYPL
jgi:hypothetical protein